MSRERMTSVDTAWLRMDSPQNLMMIVGVWVFEHPLAFETLREVIQERLLKFRRFTQKVDIDSAGAWWVDDDDFDLDRHLQRVNLPGKGGDDALQEHVGRLATEPLDPDRPLWQFQLIENYGGTHALVTRIHHCIADGIALVGVMMSLADGAPQGQRVPGGSPHDDDEAHTNPWEVYLKPLTKGTIKAINVSEVVLAKGLEVLAQPDKLGDYRHVGGQVLKDAARIALMPNDTPTRLKGRPGTRKVVAWNDPLPLSEVKLVARALGASINDVLLACVAGALRSYLREHGEGGEGTELRAMVPVNLRPLDRALELGNRFGLAPLTLPVGIASPLARVREVRRRMDELKGGYQAFLAYALLGVVGLAPKSVQAQVLDLFGRKTTAVMTNVPGPQQPVALAGTQVERLMFWVPQSGDVGMGVSILSYNGGVQFGVITDSRLCPDPQRIIDGFRPEFDKLVMILAMLPPEMLGSGMPEPGWIEQALFPQ
jgi:WS/DGAT/MGAT family acyltransferase